MVRIVGVVLWSSEEKQKAVIWCEDHAALAYLKDASDLAASLPGSWLEPVDMVRLESETVNSLRHARRVELVQAGYYPNLPELVMGTDDNSTVVPVSADRFRAAEGANKDGVKVDLGPAAERAPICFTERNQS